MAKYVNKTSLAYHLSQLNSPYESTKSLLAFCKDNIDLSEVNTILDLACGTGVNSFYLSRNHFKKQHFFGVDISNEAIKIGNDYIQKHNYSNIKLEVNNMYEILENKKRYDMTMFIHTLFAMEDAYSCLEKIMNITSKYVVLLSLFTTDHLEVLTRVTKIDDKEIEHIFQILSISRLKSFAEERGFNLKKYKEFNISFELKRQNKGLGSYTKELVDHSFDTFTGPVYLPWGFVLLEKI